MPRPLLNLTLDKFFATVDLAGPTWNGSNCWMWQGRFDRHGYGEVRLKENGRWVNRRAHRWLYQAVAGSLPASLTLDHLCRTRACVNPDHLEPVTLKDNVLRGSGITAECARKTHCKRGHEFTEENTYAWRGRRICRQCAKEREARRLRA